MIIRYARHLPARYFGAAQFGPDRNDGRIPVGTYAKSYHDPFTVPERFERRICSVRSEDRNTQTAENSILYSATTVQGQCYGDPDRDRAQRSTR